ncbi:hypothetical protein MUK42_12189 [Musa troglodytarum]|uniref:Trichome birefringence-like C-terminal domain-containing protein n=1 Tax=Musa troglodytarum TaxID=320322 RepID=A0A9E7GLX4_9LILI|nr:hypothetical protein MUK42_12189 [Musa troglodytarum]
MDRLVAFNKGLTTWAKWVDANINPAATKVFFQGISPTHYKLRYADSTGAEWGYERKELLRTNATSKRIDLPRWSGSSSRSSDERPRRHVQTSPPARHNLAFSAQKRCTSVCLQWRSSWHGLQPLVSRWPSRYLESDPVCSTSLMETIPATRTGAKTTKACNWQPVSKNYLL